MSEEEDYIEDEYINDDNDPCGVEKMKDDFTIPETEEIVEFDEIFETVKTKIINLSKYDKMMEKKVLDFLKKGKLNENRIE